MLGLDRPDSVDGWASAGPADVRTPIQEPASGAHANLSRIEGTS